MTSPSSVKLVQVVGDGRHAVVVAVADHAALRRPGRARGVDVREEVLLADRRLGLRQRARVARGEVRALGLEARQAVVGEHVPEARQAVAHLLHLGELRRVLAENAHGLRVLEDVARVLRRAVRVDRHRDSADAAEREVEERPLERRLGEDAERVALADAQGEQAVRELPDALGRLFPRDRVPVVLVLDEIRGALAPLRDRVVPEARDRPPPSVVAGVGTRSAAPSAVRARLTHARREMGLREAGR